MRGAIRACASTMLRQSGGVKVSALVDVGKLRGPVFPHGSRPLWKRCFPVEASFHYGTPDFSSPSGDWRAQRFCNDGRQAKRGRNDFFLDPATDSDSLSFPFCDLATTHEQFSRAE